MSGKKRIEIKNKKDDSFKIKIEIDTDDAPEIDEMNAEQLKAYLAELEAQKDELDACEPEDDESDEYDDWADRHEDLEDLIDEVEDRLDELHTCG